ncbi:hypothetical protein V5799_022224 [Amblyomma americanum]|uniref:Uncharacterized protein n=1 Tax=Amblyomma americanum TaxID=6943 RepID=A0AAQ4FL89_AMBAM
MFLGNNYVSINPLLLQCKVVCSGIVVSLVNAHLRTNYTIAQITEWEAQFPGISIFSAPGTATLEELGDAFGGLNASLLNDVLHESGVYYDHEEIIVSSKKAFLSYIQRLWNTSNQPLSLGYILTAVALDANAGLQAGNVLDSPTTDSWIACNSHAYKYQELWRATYVAALTNPAKNEQLRTVFEATRRALANYEPLRRLMAAGNNTQEFEAAVGNMSLLLPVDLIIRDVAVPSMSARGFVRNHLRALSFEFEVMLTKWRRGMPLVRDDIEEGAEKLLFVNETSIYVPAPTFGLLSDNTADPLLADAPVIATRMATLMSYQVAYRRTWSQETGDAIHLYR